ncbi:MAG TPA: isochorismatase family protein [Candidatus Dietzia intestinigallinarum]|nr:isochorismatase family protein [Candidatus Dietzia intestinigallinarum]
MSTTNRALIVIDVQQEYFDGPLEIQYPPRDESRAQILRAIDVADEAGIPVVIVQHELPEEAPVFAKGSAGFALHSEIEGKVNTARKSVTKHFASVFEGTDVVDWLREKGIDRVTLVGYMTNNCVIGTAVTGEPLGLTVEILSDATGAISISNDAGSASGKQVHQTLMAVLNSNFARVATTDAWAEAVAKGADLEGSNLVSSALQGREAH